MKLFGTSGIRGSASQLFSNQFCLLLGYTFGRWLSLQKKPGFVAVANDPRDSSPRIKKHVCSGLAAAGFEILDEGVVPTPALTHFARISPHVAAAVAVTGSHITADLNGVKFILGGEEISKDQEKQFEELFSQISASPLIPAEPVTKFENSAKESYLELLTQLATSPYPPWKIVVDTANGTQTQIIKDLFYNLGLDFSCTDFCDIQSPHFLPRDTEVESHFGSLVRQVLTTGADLGIGFDADGDRVIFVDDRGRFIPGDYSCALIAADLRPACIATPVSTSSVLELLGFKVYRTPVGSTHVAAAMKAHGCTFGFEPNGGAIFPDISYGRDGGATMVKVLNLLKKSGQPLSQLYDALPQLYLFRDKTDCSFTHYDRIYNHVKNKYSTFPQTDIDGVKIDLAPDEWLLFRGSGNAPEFRVFAQSPDHHRSQTLGYEGLAEVKSLIHSSPHARSYTQPSQQDSLNVLSSIDSFPDQCRQVIKEIALQQLPQACYLVDNIVVTGMGGSALGARVIAAIERQTLKIPISISTEYHLPNFVGPKTLVVVSSYSGNTEETVSALHEARARAAQIYVITSGGQLAQLAADYSLPGYIFTPSHNPSGQPRMGLGYNILSLVTLLSRCKLIHPPANLSSLPSFLASQQKDQSVIRQTATALFDKIPVIVASEHLKGGAHSLKNQFNENSKTFATFFDLPELNHHLLEGLSYPRTNTQSLAFLFIHSPTYHHQLHALYALTAQSFRKQGFPVHTLEVSGPSPLFESLGFIQTGAYLAYHLSLLNAVDPGPIPWVDWYKDEIRKMV